MKISIKQFKPIFFLFLVLSWFCIFVTLIFFPDRIVELGHNIDQVDIISDYIIGLVWFFVLGLTIFFWPVHKKDKLPLFIVWLTKGLVILGFMLFYESYYGLDAFMYFTESISPSTTYSGFEFVGHGTENIVALVTLLQKIIPNSYHAAKVACAFVGLIAIYFFYRACVLFLQREDIRIFYLFALWPSIIFWSSILGKDPIVFLGISMYIFGVVGWYRNSKIHNLFILILGIIITMFIRTWLGVILLAPTSIFVIRRMRNIIVKAVSVLLIIIAIFYSMRFLVNFINVENTQEAVMVIDSQSKGIKSGRSTREVDFKFYGVGDLVKFMPLGTFTLLFRPLPGEVNNIFGLLSGFENLILLILFLGVLKNNCWQNLKNPIIQWAIALIFIWSIIYGPYVYQNPGTSVRQRLQILPVFLAVLLYLPTKRDEDSN